MLGRQSCRSESIGGGRCEYERSMPRELPKEGVLLFCESRRLAFQNETRNRPDVRRLRTRTLIICSPRKTGATLHCPHLRFRTAKRLMPSARPELGSPGISISQFRARGSVPGDFNQLRSHTLALWLDCDDYARHKRFPSIA